MYIVNLYIIHTSFVPAASPRALSPSPEHSHKKCVSVFKIHLNLVTPKDHPLPTQHYSKVRRLFSDFDKQSLAMEFDGWLQIDHPPPFQHHSQVISDKFDGMVTS